MLFQCILALFIPTVLATIESIEFATYGTGCPQTFTIHDSTNITFEAFPTIDQPSSLPGYEFTSCPMRIEIGFNSSPAVLEFSGTIRGTAVFNSATSYGEVGIDAVYPYSANSFLSVQKPLDPVGEGQASEFVLRVGPKRLEAGCRKGVHELVVDLWTSKDGVGYVSVTGLELVLKVLRPGFSTCV